MNNKSVYIHIPFCKRICTYCDFCKVFYHEKWVLDYLKCLYNEITDLYNGEVITSIYIGGGTPSSLGINCLKELFSLLKIFNLSENFEFTFECNIEDITTELLDLLRIYKVNRLSIGLESLNVDKLKQMGRIINKKDIKNKILLCKEKGFTNINLDFIYGFNCEDSKIALKDLKDIIKLKPTHISTYSLQVEKNTWLYINNYKRMDDEIDAYIYKKINKYLKSKGYNHYEISNFAIKGYESIHNIRYWENKEYYGFGLSAASYIDGIRSTNTLSLTKYLQGNYVGEKDILTKQDIMDNHLMLGFRLVNGFNILEFERLYNVKLEDTYPIKPLLKNKDLIIKKGNIFINPDKLYIMNEILLKMI